MKKCKHKKLALVYGAIEDLRPDQEPFEADVIEEMADIYTSIPFSGHWCPKCEMLVDIELEQ